MKIYKEDAVYKPRAETPGDTWPANNTLSPISSFCNCVV